MAVLVAMFVVTLKLGVGGPFSHSPNAVSVVTEFLFLERARDAALIMNSVTRPRSASACRVRGALGGSSALAGVSGPLPYIRVLWWDKRDAYPTVRAGISGALGGLSAFVSTPKALDRIIRNPKRKRGRHAVFLAYASGYDARCFGQDSRNAHLSNGLQRQTSTS